MLYGVFPISCIRRLYVYFDIEYPVFVVGNGIAFVSVLYELMFLFNCCCCWLVTVRCFVANKISRPFFYCFLFSLYISFRSVRSRFHLFACRLFLSRSVFERYSLFLSEFNSLAPIQQIKMVHDTKKRRRKSHAMVFCLCDLLVN